MGSITHPNNIDISRVYNVGVRVHRRCYRQGYSFIEHTRCFGFQLLLQREDQAVLADREADAFCGRAAKELDEAIVTAAAADGVLRAEAARGDFKRGAHV